jgi:AGCS family alanine or glycine:cation symporter
MLETTRHVIAWASGAVWGPWTVALLLGTGLYLTLRLRFVQIRHLREALATLRPGARAVARGAMTPFQAFMTGLSGSVGTGNVAGVATAIISGGPGAVFWIWCYGFFATTIKFTEATLGVRYRSRTPDHLAVGPMQYLADGVGSPMLAKLYALIAGVAALTTTPFTQPNSIAVVFKSQLGVPTWLCGTILAVLTWVVVIGGMRSVGRVAERVAPAMVALYLVGGVVVIAIFADRIPQVLALIVHSAFSGHAAGGGAVGIGVMTAMRYGLARGIYANEAGYGTAAVAYGSAQTDQPVRQGMNAMMEVYIVSFVTSTISAMTILVSGVWQSGANSTALVASAFDAAFPLGGLLVLVCAALFGYTTLIGWGYYGEQFLEYLFGPKIIRPYRWIYCGLIVVGATTAVELVWSWGDLMNGLQIFPNLVGLLALSGLVAGLLRRHERGGKPRDV